jgi:4-amino-4-deoxy-L-arabinose transferase-like glycosyltransferase
VADDTRAPAGPRGGEAILAGLLLFLLLGRLTNALATTPPGPDLPSYVRAARNGGLFDTGFREPLFPWAIRLAGLAGFEGEAGGRAAATLATIVLGVAVYAFARRHGGPVAALGAGLAFATTPAAAHYAAAGDRGPLLALCLLVWTRAAFERRSAVATGLAAGAAILGRLDLIAVVVIGAALAVALGPARFREARRQAAALGLAAILVAPYLAANLARHGDPFYPQALHARSWANHEFAGRPGFPVTLAEVHADEYRGGPLSPFEYLVGMHTPAELAAGWARGLGRAFAAYLPAYAVGAPAVCVLALVGAVAAAFAGAAHLPLALVALLAPFGYLYALDQIAPGSGVEARYVLHAAPIIHVLAGIGLAALIPAAPTAPTAPRGSES